MGPHWTCPVYFSFGIAQSFKVGLFVRFARVGAGLTFLGLGPTKCPNKQLAAWFPCKPLYSHIMWMNAKILAEHTFKLSCDDQCVFTTANPNYCGIGGAGVQGHSMRDTPGCLSGMIPASALKKLRVIPHWSQDSVLFLVSVMRYATASGGLDTKCRAAVPHPTA